MGTDSATDTRTGDLDDKRRRSFRTMPALLLGIIALVLTGGALQQARSVLIPFILAWMMAQILSPLVKFFARIRVPTALATVFLLVVLLFVFYWTAIYISVGAVSFINKLQQDYSPRIVELASAGIRSASERFDVLSDQEMQSAIRQEVTGATRMLVGIAGSLAGALTGVLFKLVLVFVMVAFILLAQPYTEGKVRKAFSSDIADRVVRISSAISRQMSSYLAMQFLLSLLTGILVWLCLTLIGVDAAVTWGALAFVLNFVPTIGSIVAGVPPVLLAFLQFDSVWPAVWALVCVVAINQVIGNILSPKLMGDRLDLSPMTILASLLFWGWLWGVAGMFLSVVIACSIRIVCENIEALRPIAVMMQSGKRLQEQSPPAPA